MTIAWQEELRPGEALKGIVKQATAALVAMDADRLEELARCCADLNRKLEESGDLTSGASAIQEAAGDLDLLRRVLFETRANLTVFSRLHAIRLREALSRQDLHTGGRAGSASQFLNAWSSLERKVDYGDN